MRRQVLSFILLASFLITFFLISCGDDVEEKRGITPQGLDNYMKYLNVATEVAANACMVEALLDSPTSVGNGTTITFATNEEFSITLGSDTIIGNLIDVVCVPATGGGTLTLNGNLSFDYEGETIVVELKDFIITGLTFDGSKFTNFDSGTDWKIGSLDRVKPSLVLVKDLVNISAFETTSTNDCFVMVYPETTIGSDGKIAPTGVVFNFNFGGNSDFKFDLSAGNKLGLIVELWSILPNEPYNLEQINSSPSVEINERLVVTSYAWRSLIRQIDYDAAGKPVSTNESLQGKEVPYALDEAQKYTPFHIRSATELN